MLEPKVQRGFVAKERKAEQRLWDNTIIQAQTVGLSYKDKQLFIKVALDSSRMWQSIQLRAIAYSEKCCDYGGINDHLIQLIGPDSHIGKSHHTCFCQEMFYNVHYSFRPGFGVPVADE